MSTEPIDDPSLPTNGNVDSLAIFLDGVERAKADPEVRNVVIDVSNNDGGSDDIVLYMASIIANRQYERVQNPLTNQTIIERYDVDRNLDGMFDEKDAQVDYSDLNFALLTSKTSYSCGNMFACVMKDAGIRILGERSGGGSCGVQFQMTGDGPTYLHSSWLARLINDAGEDMDVGAPVDVDLIERSGSKRVQSEYDDKTTGKHMEAEIYDYSSFYDIGVLNEVMNELFKD